MAASSVPIPSITATGYQMPAFADVLAAHKADYVGIYAVDFDNSDQDLEWVSTEAQAFYDTFALGLAIYNSFSPQTAQGTGLSSIVKVNGLTREGASYSTVDLVNIGQAGRTVYGPIVKDASGNTWTMPNFTFPLSGQLTVTATCSALGAIAAPAGTAWSIASPQLGWQSVSNVSDGSLGAAVESDAQLRIRQAQSTAIPSQNLLEGMQGALLALPNVSRLKIYENDTSVTDANGLPGHTISVVIDGGDGLAICQTIAAKKTPGAGTFGSASQTTTNAYGTPRQIRYYRPTEPPITVNMTVRAFTNYTLDTETAIKQAVSDWINSLGIGQSVLLGRVYGPALLSGTPAASLFEVTSIVIARDSAVPQAADIPIAFNEAPFAMPSYINIGYVS